MTLTFKPGTYVMDRSDSSRYHRSVYEVTGESFDRSIVRRVGHIEGGRLCCPPGHDRGVTHRTTANLQEYR